MKKVMSKYYSMLPLALVGLFFMIKSCSFPIHDFANYYFGAKLMAQQQFNASTYFPIEFNKAIFASGHKWIFASYAPNTPFLAFFFLPFSLVPVALSKFIFNAIGLFLFGYSVKRLSDFYKVDAIYLVLLPLVFFIPIKNQILFGQVYFLMFFLLSECWTAYLKNRRPLSAAFLAIAILLKGFPIVLVLFFLFKRQFKYLIMLSCFTAIFLGVSLLFSGIEIWQFYLSDVLSKASNGEISEAYVPNYQSVFMFLKELLVYDSIENSASRFYFPNFFHGLVTASKAMLVIAGCYITTKSENLLMVFSYWIFVMILLSPYGSTYNFIFLILPLFAVMQNEISKLNRNIGIILIFLISNVSTSVFLKYSFPLNYIRLFLLIASFVLLVAYFRKLIKYPIMLSLALLAGSFSFIFPKEKGTESEYLLKKGSPILIYDYFIMNNRLIYFFWDENGANQESIAFKCSNRTSLKLAENKILHHGATLLADRSNKKKPILVDGKSVIYLSDLDRGIGFYTLRRIKLNSTIHE